MKPEKITLKYNGLWREGIKMPYAKRFICPGDEFITSKEAYENELKGFLVPGTDKPLYTLVKEKEIKKTGSDPEIKSEG